MKDWVRPYLLEEYERFFEQLGGGRDLKKARMEEFANMLEYNAAVLLELSSRVNSHFSEFGVQGVADRFAEAFGYVLSNLPKEVFMRLVGMRNVFYTFTPNPGAEVKQFMLDEEDVTQWGKIIVVTFPYEAGLMPVLALVGTVVHELVHVYLLAEEITSNDAMEAEIDRVALEWGYQNEIAAMREYYEQYELEQAAMREYYEQYDLEEESDDNP